MRDSLVVLIRHLLQAQERYASLLDIAKKQQQ